MAARGLMSGRGPLRRSGRDEVGTSSDEAKPNSAYSPFEKSRVNGRARNDATRQFSGILAQKSADFSARISMACRFFFFLNNVFLFLKVCM